MAHFAKLDENNVVTDIVVVANEVIIDENGVEQEQLGIDFLKGLHGQDTTWVQTSYNYNFRCRYAMIGGTYNPTHDIFIVPKIHDSWTLNTTTGEWDPPIPRPDYTESYSWDEALYQADTGNPKTQGWVWNDPADIEAAIG